MDDSFENQEWGEGSGARGSDMGDVSGLNTKTMIGAMR